MALGVLLLLPLAAAIVESVGFMADCDYDCGDMGGRGLFLSVLLSTPPAALGVLMIASTSSGRAAGRLVGRAVIAVVVLCTLALAGAAIATGITGLDQLISEPQVHRIGQTKPSAYERREAREDGIALLVVAAVLATMATASVLALRAAWRRRR
jgi:hypothetical protein